MHHPLELFSPILMLLVIGVVSVVSSRALRLSPIVGYVLAGLAIGPNGFSLIQESETTALLAELGVVFLLFDIGLHFSLHHLWEVRQRVLQLAPLQMGFSALALAGICLLFGLSLATAALVGVALALSSTAVVVQALRERGSSPIGKSALAVLIFQDICAMLLLIGLAATSGAGPGEAAGGGSAVAASVGLAVGKAAIAFVVSILLSRFLIRPLFTLIARTQNEEIFTAVTLLMVLAAATATAELGLSLTLGAFLGGMIVAETRYRPVVQTEVKPFRGLLLGFFFITVGMSLDASMILQDWAEVLLILVLLLAAKIAGAALAGKAFGMPTACSINFAMLMCQGSEFAFVVFADDGARAALGEERVGPLLTAVTASLALTPFLADLGTRWARIMSDRKRRADAAAGEAGAAPAHAPLVLFGMGEVGRLVADGLDAHQIPYLAVERDYEAYVKAQGAGYQVTYGDLADLRLASVLEMERRPMLVITQARVEIAAELTPIVRERFPDLERVVAVDDESTATRYRDLGVKPFMSRSVPRGIELAEYVLRFENISDERIAQWMNGVRSDSLAALAS